MTRLGHPAQNETGSGFLHKGLKTMGDPVVVSSFPRSGTHLMIDLLRRQFPDCRAMKRLGESNHTVYLDLDHLMYGSRITDQQALALCRRAKRPIIKTHALPNFDDWQCDPAWSNWIRERATIVYMVRHPKKVLCSYQLLAQEMSDEAECSLEKFLSTECNYYLPNRVSTDRPTRLWSNHVEEWLSYGSTNRFAYNKLIGDTESTLRRLSDLIGASCEMRRPLLPKRPRGMWKGRVDRMFSRSPGSTAVLQKKWRHANKLWIDECTPTTESLYRQDCQPTVDQLDSNDLTRVTSVKAPLPINPSYQLKHPVFLIGTQRSGTTWLGGLLGKTPNFAYWIEPRQVWTYGNWRRDDDLLLREHATEEVADYIRKRFYDFTVSRGASRFCEKTPSNCLRIPFIHEVFPDGKLILIIRDGRAVFRSTREIQSKGIDWGRIKDRMMESSIKELPAYFDRRFWLFYKLLGKRLDFWGIRPPGWKDWITDHTPAQVIALQWSNSISIAHEAMQQLPTENRLLVRYEELISNPREQMQNICDFAEIEDRDALVKSVVDSVRPDVPTKWKNEVSPDLLDEIRPFMEPTLKKLGYQW